MTRVAVVVLSWNRKGDTLACLRSLARVEHEPLDVIVVDNASGDGTPEAVAAEFPAVDLVRNERNLGYTGGMNVGLRRALERSVDYVLVLNNDVEVDPEFLAPLLEEAARSPNTGALSPIMYFADPPDLVWYAGASFDPRRGYNGRQHGYRRPAPDLSAALETDRVCGAAMLTPRAVLERVGLFDDDLFAYGEDSDWSLRARAAGYCLVVVPSSRVWHKVSASSGGESSPDTLYYSVRNLLRICERHAPLGPFGTWRRRLVLVGAHLAQALLSATRRAGAGAVLDGWQDFRRGRFGARRP